MALCLIPFSTVVSPSKFLLRVVGSWRAASGGMKGAHIGLCLMHSLVQLSAKVGRPPTATRRASSGRSKGAQGRFTPWGHVHIRFIRNGLCSFFAILSRTLGRAISVNRRPVVGIGDAFRGLFLLFPVSSMVIRDWECIL